MKSNRSSKYFIISLVFVLIIISFSFVTCKPAKPIQYEPIKEPPEEEILEATPTEVTLEATTLPVKLKIGPNGGKVKVGLLSVSIPQGALQKEVDIVLEAMPEELPAPAPLFATLIGGANFKPDGLSFVKPVTITIPLGSYYEPSTSLPLFRLEGQAFVDTGILATVTEEGYAALANVSHFTIYSLFEGWAEMKEACAKTGRDTTGPEQDIQEMIDVIAETQTVGLGQEIIIDGECYLIIGISYTLQYEKDGQLETISEIIGTTEDPEGKYTHNVGRLTCDFEDSKGKSQVYDLTINIILEPCEGTWEGVLESHYSMKSPVWDTEVDMLILFTFKVDSTGKITGSGKGSHPVVRIVLTPFRDLGGPPCPVQIDLPEEWPVSVSGQRKGANFDLKLDYSVASTGYIPYCEHRFNQESFIGIGPIGPSSDERSFRLEFVIAAQDGAQETCSGAGAVLGPPSGIEMPEGVPAVSVTPTVTCTVTIHRLR